MTADERAALLAKVRTIPGELREKVRQVLLELRREGRDVTIRAVVKRVTGKRDHVAQVVAAWREDLLDDAGSWERLDAPAPASVPPATAGAAASAAPAPVPEVADLLRRVDTADTPSKLGEVAQAVASLVIARQLEVAAGRLVIDACKEQRQSILTARQVEPPAEDERTLCLVSRDALELARAFDTIGNGRRRALLAQVAALLVDEDVDDHPNLDGAGPAPVDLAAELEALGLDAFGEPIAGEADEGLRAIARMTLPAAWRLLVRGETPGNA